MKLKYGQIGVGHAHANKIAVYRQSPDWEVVGVVEPDPELRRHAEKDPLYRDLPFMTQEQLLNTPGLQVVGVETPVRDLLNTAEVCVAAGKHLCAECEWQAACGGAAASLYPYGNSYNAAACNGLDKNLGAIVPTAQVSTCLGGYTGVYDMSGNAYERTATCGNGTCRVRGGSYRSSSAAGLLKCTTGFDFPEASPDDAVGFRCCL